MKRTLSLIAAAAIVAAAPAQAEDASTAFRPSGNWTADYGDDYCRLIRTFTDGTREMGLVLQRLQPGAQVQLMVVGEGMRPFRGADQIGYQFLPTGSQGEARYTRSETADGKSYVIFDPVTLAPSAHGTTPASPPVYSRAQEQESARGITGLMLTEGLVSPVRVETGSLRAPIEELQACADDLLTVWGLDAEKHKTMTMPPVMNPNPSGVLPQGAVSFREFRKMSGGFSEARLLIGDVRLLIGADGKVTDCAIYSASLSQSRNGRICSLVRERASFQPARDAAGQPMASLWMGSPMSLGPPPRASDGRTIPWYMPDQRQIPIPDLPAPVLWFPG